MLLVISQLLPQLEQLLSPAVKALLNNAVDIKAQSVVEAQDMDETCLGALLGEKPALQHSQQTEDILHCAADGAFQDLLVNAIAMIGLDEIVAMK